MAPQVKLVVGLGNPGPEYEPTRHNLGFRVVHHLVRTLDAHGPVASCESEIFQAHQEAVPWMLARPLTYMNRSGRAVKCLVERLGLRWEDLLVVYDDLALPVGHIRVRARGSSGGHRGMQSIIDALATQEIPRVRLGIGSPPPGVAAEAYVLSAPPAAEAAALAEAVARAAEAAECWGRFGIEEAMRRYNGR